MNHCGQHDAVTVISFYELRIVVWMNEVDCWHNSLSVSYQKTERQSRAEYSLFSLESTVTTIAANRKQEATSLLPSELCALF